MSNLKRNISSDDLKIEDIITLLEKDKWLIPTFQRDFVWAPDNIIKLWDSIYRFYPIGSLLFWETDSYLHTHRKLGGFVFPHDEDTLKKFKEWKYILDGQQRATSLLVSFLGGTGRVEGNEKFNYLLYFDATKAEFFFAGQLEERKKNTHEQFLVRLRDVPKWKFNFYKDVAAVEGFSPDIENNLQQLSRIFSDYKISVVRLTGVGVNEVCEIFERINQEGKKLHPVDIIVARTYRAVDLENSRTGFYLRDNLKSFKEGLIEQGNRFQDIDDLNIIQMIALCLRKNDANSRSRFGITPAALDNLTASDFEDNWEECQGTIYNTIKFLCDLKIHGPGLLPYVYLMLTLCFYFHRNRSVNRSIAKQWFWRSAFGLDDFRSSSMVYDFCENFFNRVESGDSVEIPALVISKKRLIQSSYNYRNALSRAVLAFLANQQPRDFSDPDANVLDNTYLLLSQAPNLHHIYPLNFLKTIEGLHLDADRNSLMNICFLRAITNINIRDKNPLTYFDDYKSVNNFDLILKSHLIPEEFLHKEVFSVEDYKSFLELRAQLFAEKLREVLPDVDVTITD